MVEKRSLSLPENKELLTPGDKILQGCRDALLSALSYLWREFAIWITKSFEKGRMMDDVNRMMDLGIENIGEEAKIRERINYYWKHDDGGGCRIGISKAVKIYYLKIKTEREKFSEAIKKIQDGTREGLNSLKWLIINNRKGGKTPNL